MNKEAGERKKWGNKFLWIILGILIIVMIGLIIGLVITKQREKEAIEGLQETTQSQEEEEEDFAMEEGVVYAGGAVELEGTDPADRGVEIEYSEMVAEREKDYETVNQLNAEITPMSVAQAEQFLDEKLSEYAGTSMEFRIKIMKIWVYINGGDYNSALALAQQLEPGQLNEVNQMDYNRVMSRIYEGLGNMNLANQYDNQWQQLYIKVYGEGAGLE